MIAIKQTRMLSSLPFVNNEKICEKSESIIKTPTTVLKKNRVTLQVNFILNRYSNSMRIDIIFQKIQQFC